MQIETESNPRWGSEDLWLAILLGILSTLMYSSTTRGQENGVDVIKRWDFGAADDVKGVGWPDLWTRRTGVDYPQYLSIRITNPANSKEQLQEVDRWRRLYAQLKLGWEKGTLPWNITPERTPEELDKILEVTILNPYLEMVMDGGKAEINSPLVTIEPDSIYGISCSINADCDSREYEAMAILRLCDSNKSVIYEQVTPAIDHSNGWVAVTADTQYPYNPNVTFAQVALVVNPKTPDAFRGRFGFDSVRITRAPRLSLSVDKPSGIYRQGQNIKVECKAIGIATLQNQVELILLDKEGVTVSHSVRTLDKESSSSTNSPVLVATNNRPKPSGQTYWSGRTSWELPSLEPGYYEVRTQLQRSTKRNSSLKQQIVVLDNNSEQIINNQLGWVMKDAENSTTKIETDLLLTILRESSIGKIKLPIWINSRSQEQVDALLNRIDRIQNAGITCVGVVASPPKALRSSFVLARGDGTGSFLEDWTVAQALLEPIIRETSFRILQYQIGWDDEPDLVANPRVGSTVESFNRLLNRYSQESRLVATNNPLNRTNQVKLIDRWQLSTQIPFTAEEQKRILLTAAANSPQGNTMPWMHVTPLPPSRYSLATRAQDLAERILLLTEPQIQSKTVGWVFDPTSDDVEVYDAVKGPGVFFSPLRTLARATAGRQQIGSLPTSKLGRNHILSSGKDCRIVAWSPEPKAAELFFGKDAVAYDLWGKRVPLEKLGANRHNLQRINLNEFPIVIDQVDLRAIRWFMNAQLLTKNIDVVIGKMETVDIKFENPMPFSVLGNAKVICDAFEPEESPASFQVPAFGTQILNVPVRIRPEANVGMTPIQVVLQVDDIPMVIEGEILIGNDDFDFSIEYEITPDNQLVIRVDAVNKTESPASFDCVLRVTGRRAERRQILDLATKTSRTFVFPDADQLVGKLIRLQCEQGDKNRIINKQVRIENRPMVDKSSAP